MSLGIISFCTFFFCVRDKKLRSGEETRFFFISENLWLGTYIAFTCNLFEFIAVFKKQFGNVYALAGISKKIFMALICNILSDICVAFVHPRVQFK